MKPNIEGMPEKYVYNVALEVLKWHPDFKFYACGDIAKKYGKTRQWWHKLMRQGKLKYHQTAAGKITLQKYLDEYFHSKKSKTPKV